MVVTDLPSSISNPSLPMIRYLLVLLMSVVSLASAATPLADLPNDTWSMGTPLLQLSISDLLQYQRTKMRAGDAYAPFRKTGMHRQRITQAFPGSDSLRIWTYRVSTNEDYQNDKPSYTLFKPQSLSSMVIYDAPHGLTQLFFWDKHYYRSFAEQLRRLHYDLQTSPKQPNRLQFRNPQQSVWVDIIIWQDIYIMEIGR